MDVAYKAADVTLQTAIDDEEARATAAEATLSAAISSEETARIAGDNTLQTNINSLSSSVASDFASLEADFVAAVTAEENARIAADTQLTNDLATEVARAQAAETTLTTNLAAEITRAQGEEGRIEGKFDNHFNGFVKVASLGDADNVMGLATHYVVNVTSPKSFTIPAMTEAYFIMVKVAEGSEPVTLNAGSGESIDGEVDGSIVLNGGVRATLVKVGGVMYLF